MSQASTNSDLDLEYLKNEITKRITAITKEEQSIQRTIDSMRNDHTGRDVTYKDIFNKKKDLYLAIRNRLNDDAGFQKLVGQLDNLKTTIERKEKELPEKKPTGKATLLQKGYTAISGKQNNATIDLENYKNTDSEISRLNVLAKQIEELKEIYNEADQNKNTTTEGGKRKSRRSRKSKKSKKSKQSRKNRRKSHHRHRR